jgi:predicted anti-sigma-YlaC factor YlaD
MKCSLIRDLMPIYDNHSCSKETESIIHGHLKNCQSCRTIFEAMHEGVGLKNSINLQKEFPDNNSKEAEFWGKYYGSLIARGLGVFIIVYITAIILRLWLKA